jgi:hypothetical protein
MFWHDTFKMRSSLGIAMMQSKLLSMLSILSATILVSGAIQNTTMAYPDSQEKEGYSDHDKMMLKPGSYALFKYSLFWQR